MKFSELIFGIVFIVILTSCAGSKGGKKKPPSGSGKPPTGSGKPPTSSGGSNAPSYGWKPPTSGQSTGGYNPPSGGSHNNPYGGTHNNPNSGTHNNPYSGTNNNPLNGGNNPSYGWKPPTSGQSTGGYNPPSGGSHNNPYGGTNNNPYSGTHNNPLNGGNNPSYGFQPPTSGQSTGGYNPSSGGTYNNPYSGTHNNPNSGTHNNPYGGTNNNPLNGGNNPSYGWKPPTSGQSTGGYNPSSGGTYNNPYSGTHNNPYSGTHNSQPYNPHFSPTQNFGSPSPYNPYVGHSPLPGGQYNPPVGHIPITVVQTSGQSYSKPGLGQMAKEAFVFAGVNAGVQSIANRIIPGGISGQRHDPSPNSGASRSVVAPISTNNTVVYNNYYYNNGSAGEQKPTEQKPAVEQNPSVPTFIPLNDTQITKFTEELFAKDKNNAFKYVRMNLQGQKTDDSVTDIASETFLTVENMIYETPTIKSVLNLYENYEVKAEVKETITESREKKENDLLDQFIQTDVMKATIEFLSKRGYIVEKNFKADLRTMWFTLFPRTDKGSGSSGFETVFLAEIINNETIGMHNWIYYAKQETAKKLNYLGYIHEKKLGSNGAVVKLRSILDGAIQPVTTIFVGTSPELEMALYTMCFYVRPNYPCPIELGGAKFEIIVNAITYESKGIIVSAYPEI